ncbi:MAG TPA: 4Fe-4S binding protein [Bacteroidales bacterium]|nr:4Fe-4S binding protein [Bacteroidales bacterium]
MKKIYSLNFLSRFLFLILTPVFFQYSALGFIWHSIYWGVITFVLIIWTVLILISPLFGRIGCGWFCFMGTVTDYGGNHAFHKTKWKKPKLWTRVLILIPFFASAVIFYFLNKERGITHGFTIIPTFLKPELNEHYKIVWMGDVSFALIMSLFLDKRWACKNLCMMGTLCAAGATYSRLIPVVDAGKCTRCGKCENECLVKIPIIDYVKQNKGLVTNSECILCGKCAEVCRFDAIKLKFIWSRDKYKNRIESLVTDQQELVSSKDGPRLEMQIK